MKYLKMIAAVILLSYFSCPATAAYTLTYDASDGSLTIDTQGGQLGGYVLELDEDVFVGPFVTTDPPANPINLTVNAHQIPIFDSQPTSRTGFSWYLSEVLQPSQPPKSGVFNIGQVAQRGLTEQEYYQYFENTNTRWQYITGQDSDNFDLIYHVPEPTSIALLGIATLLSARRRSRGC